MLVKRLAIWCFLVGLSGHCLFAQGAPLTGQVLAGSDPVPFASIYLEGTDIGTSSGPDGSFSISGIPAGNYSLVVSSVGFET